jgi:hypothetical protein
VSRGTPVDVPVHPAFLVEKTDGDIDTIIHVGG